MGSLKSSRYSIFTVLVLVSVSTVTVSVWWPYCLGLVVSRPRQFKTPDKWGDASCNLPNGWHTAILCLKRI